MFTTIHGFSALMTSRTLCRPSGAQVGSGGMIGRKGSDELSSLRRNVGSRPCRCDGRANLWVGCHRWPPLSLRRGRKFDTGGFAVGEERRSYTAAERQHDSREERAMIGYGKQLLLIHGPETKEPPVVAMLEQEGFVVDQVHDAVQALGEMQVRRFDAVVIGHHISDLNGLALLRQSRTTWPERPIILFTEVDLDMYDLARALGAFAWVRKSSDPGILLSMLKLAMTHGVRQKSEPTLEAVGL